MATDAAADGNSDVRELSQAVRSLEAALRQHIVVLNKLSLAPPAGPAPGGGAWRRQPGVVPPLQAPREPPSMLGSRSTPGKTKAPIKKSDKIVVYVRVVFLKIGEIDTLKEKYTADVFVQARWREPALDGQPVDDDEINWDEHWRPQISIENVIGEGNEAVWHTVTWDREGRAMVYEKMRVKADFLEFLELNKFPFDTQDLTITVTTEKGEDELSLEEDPAEVSGLNVASFMNEQEWRLHTHIETWQKTCTTAFKNQRHKHPAVSFACKATRRPGFFLWNIFFVMCFICSLSFATFTVNTDIPQNRLQLSFILLLTTITFKFVVNQSLPRISYLTYLDKYILTSMSILCLICVWHSVVPEITDARVRVLADRVALGCLGLIYVVFHVAFTLWVFCSAKRQSYRLSFKAKEHADKLKISESKESKDSNVSLRSSRSQNLATNNWTGAVATKVGPIQQPP